MIVRIWRGETAVDKAASYLDYIKATGVVGYRDTPGNHGVMVLRRRIDDRLEWLIVSLWESVEAIERFAGIDIETAVYYPQDREYLLRLERQVRHYELLVEADLDPNGGEGTV